MFYIVGNFSFRTANNTISSRKIARVFRRTVSLQYSRRPKVVIPNLVVFIKFSPIFSMKPTENRRICLFNLCKQCTLDSFCTPSEHPTLPKAFYRIQISTQISKQPPYVFMKTFHYKTYRLYDIINMEKNGVMLWLTSSFIQPLSITINVKITRVTYSLHF